MRGGQHAGREPCSPGRHQREALGDQPATPVLPCKVRKVPLSKRRLSPREGRRQGPSTVQRAPARTRHAGIRPTHSPRRATQGRARRTPSSAPRRDAPDAQPTVRHTGKRPTNTPGRPPAGAPIPRTLDSAPRRSTHDTNPDLSKTCQDIRTCPVAAGGFPVLFLPWHCHTTPLSHPRTPSSTPRRDETDAHPQGTPRRDTVQCTPGSAPRRSTRPRTPRSAPRWGHEEPEDLKEEESTHRQNQAECLQGHLKKRMSSD